MIHRIDWKGWVVVAVSLAILGLAGCGGSGGSVSGLSKRAFVSDFADGTLHIENAAIDEESEFTIATGNEPNAIALSPDKTVTLVFDTLDLSLAVVSTHLEAVQGRVGLPSPSTSYVAMSDDENGFVAVPNCPPALCGGFSNVVENLDIFMNFDISNTVTVALNTNTGIYQPLNVARTLVLSPTENFMLVFGGPADHQNMFTIIDTTLAENSTTVATAGTLMFGPAFDMPVWGVFTSDGTKAYILNCGPECGGTTASVTPVDLTTTPPTAGTPVPVPSATVGLLNGTTLYVAGTPPNQSASFCSPLAVSVCGTLSVLNTGSLASGPTATVPVSDGTHTLMSQGADNKLFIGAGPTCTNGCLSIFDTSNNQAGVDGFVNGQCPAAAACPSNVTGFAPISERSVMYVIEDVTAGTLGCSGQLPCLGKLRIYDTTAPATKPTLTPTQINVVGKAIDVKYVDQ